MAMISDVTGEVPEDYVATATNDVPAAAAYPADNTASRPVARIFRGASWTFAGTVVGQAIALGSTVLVARSMGKTLYGQLGIVQSTTLMLASIAGAGFGITATRYVSSYRIKDPDRVGRILGMLSVVAASTGLLFTMMMATLSSQLAQHAFDSQGLSTALILGAPSIFFLTLNGFQIGALVGLEAFRRSAVVVLVQASANAVCMLAAARAWGLNGAAAALSIGGLLTFLVYYVVLAKACSESGIIVSYRHAFQEKLAFFDFGLPAAIAGILGNVSIWACYAMTVKMADGFKEVAAISAANNVRQFILFVPGIVARVALPINCNEHGQGRHVHSSVMRQFQITIAMALLAATVLVVSAPTVLRLFGKEFAGDRMVMMIFIVVAVLEVAAANLSNVLVIFSRLWLQVASIAIWSVVLFGTAAALRHTFRAAVAVGTGYLLAWLVSLGLYWLWARRLLLQSAVYERP